MSEWKPGDVVTTGGAVPVVVYSTAEAPDEVRFTNRFGHQFPIRHLAANARRLVVLDPEDAEQVGRLGELLDRRGPSVVNLANALREFANPTDRIEEPQGLGAVVEDAEGVEWVRTERRSNLSGSVWQSAFHVTQADRALTREWADVKAVRKLADGWTP